jgi:hypothetical protein
MLGQTWHTELGFAGGVAPVVRRADPGFAFSARLSAE